MTSVDKKVTDKITSVVFLQFCIRLVELVELGNSTRISQAWLNVTGSIYVSPSHSWLYGVVVKTPDWKSVGNESKYRNFSFFGKKT